MSADGVCVRERGRERVCVCVTVDNIVCLSLAAAIRRTFREQIILHMVSRVLRLFFKFNECGWWTYWPVHSWPGLVSYRQQTTSWFLHAARNCTEIELTPVVSGAKHHVQNQR